MVTTVFVVGRRLPVLTSSSMEDDPNFQDAILTLHHISMRTLFDTRAGKIVENQHGRAYIQNIRV